MGAKIPASQVSSRQKYSFDDSEYVLVNLIMTPPKHLIVIHGRATKPAEREKKRLVKESILHGLGRVSPEAAAKIRSGEVKLSLAYYGDISNAEMVKAGKKVLQELKGRDPDHGNAACELDGSYDADLKSLFARKSFTKSDYNKLLKEVTDLSAVDNVASAVSGVLNLLGLSDRVIRAATPDMGAYLTTRTVGSAVRVRLQKPLESALKKNADVCLVAHSMGCIGSYDILWKFSRMSEYAHLRGKKVNRWITLGCPLGEPGVQDNLYDASEGKDGKYPTGIIDKWINFAAKDDFVAHDEDLADDFREMIVRGFVSSIVDKKIYNFWSGSGGSNPHKLYGYLDHPDVAKEIADWVND